MLILRIVCVSPKQTAPKALFASFKERGRKGLGGEGKEGK